jgi:LPS sulfotransferase NodH
LISFDGLNKAEILDVLFEQPIYIFLRRRNRVKQAISFAKAYQTDTFLVAEKSGDHQNSILFYDRRLISYYLKKFILDELKWVRFFQIFDIKPYELWCEDVKENYPETMNLLFNLL